MRPTWNGPRMVVQAGERRVFGGPGGPHDVQELWRWWCATCSMRERHVGGNGDDLDDALTWFVEHMAAEHADE